MSGLSRTPGKRVRVNSPPRVRIPPSPPVIDELNFSHINQRVTGNLRFDKLQILRMFITHVVHLFYIQNLIRLNIKLLINYWYGKLLANPTPINTIRHLINNL
jgi:hypothetical protein